MIDINWTNFISNTGFPIVVAAWFMLRMEKVLKSHTEVCLNHSVMVKELIDKLRKAKVKW